MTFYIAKGTKVKATADTLDEARAKSIGYAKTRPYKEVLIYKDTHSDATFVGYSMAYDENGRYACTVYKPADSRNAYKIKNNGTLGSVFSEY